MSNADVNGQFSLVSLDILLMDELLDRPPARFALTVLTAGLVACLLPFIYLLPLNIPPTILKWPVVLLSGCTAGLAARLLMKGSPAGLQFGAAFVAILISTLILGWLTLNLIGYNWLVDTGLSSSARWGTELLLECLAAAFTLRAWNSSIPKIRMPSRSGKVKKQPANKQAGKPKSPAPKKSAKRPAKPAPIGARIKTRPPAPKKPARREVLVVPNINRQNQSDSSRQDVFKSLENRIKRFWESAIFRKNGAGKLEEKSAKIGLIKPRKAQPKPKAQVESTTVRLLGEVEHRCPYCLEIVKKNDPRGIKVCPICQTQHHLDCWNITGVCQVPHQSE